MIERYTRPEMGRIWTEEKKFSTWLRVEISVCEELCRMGRVPEVALKGIKQKAGFDVKRVHEIEKEVQHDVIAFLKSVEEKVGEEARFLHFGMTSSDVVDTAFALQLIEAADQLLEDVRTLKEAIKSKAMEHRRTVMIGRTHGVHAEPITFGLKMAIWYEEMKRNEERLRHGREAVRFGKISGAVGTFKHLPPHVEEAVCRDLGLCPEPVSNQVVQRDRHAQFFLTLSLIGCSVEKFATEIRHLQRTEVLEAEEPFGRGQRGSSAMPHKRNPIGAENICGLARLLRGYAMAAMEDVALWHERDISHSSVERVIAPDSTILLDFMLARMTGLIRGLVVHPQAMSRNLSRLGGLVFSESVMLALVETGMSRDDAYRLIQGYARRAWEEGTNFGDEIRKDPEILKRLKGEEIDELFNPTNHLKQVDYIFDRVFGV
jgi:adenylosuccinate lyase